MEKTSLRVKADNARNIRCCTLICVLENPTSIENIGTVIRNIDFLGISKLYIVSSKFTKNNFPELGRHNKNPSNMLYRTSVSAVQWVYIHHFSTTSECFEYLEKNNYSSLCTSPHIKEQTNLPLLSSNFTKYKKLAIWFGNESHGISSEAIYKSQGCIQIEMCGIVESLNLAVCTGIILHFIASQRRQFSSSLHKRKSLECSPTDSLL